MDQWKNRIRALFRMDAQMQVYHYVNGDFIPVKGCKINTSSYEELVEYVKNLADKNKAFKEECSEIKQNLTTNLNRIMDVQNDHNDNDKLDKLMKLMEVLLKKHKIEENI